jgi:hypothetical protein
MKPIRNWYFAKAQNSPKGGITKKQTSILREDDKLSQYKNRIDTNYKLINYS